MSRSFHFCHDIDGLYRFCYVYERVGVFFSSADTGGQGNAVCCRQGALASHYYLFHYYFLVVYRCRVWPKEDERYVQLLVSLIYHVTGIKMRAYFASPNDPKRFKVMGKRHKRSKYAGGKEPVFGARVRCFAAFRRLRILWAAHTKPFNSGLLAGEALVSPFFGLQGAPHAELPVCVEAAFPPQSIA
jgi:hypothetical protein